MKTEPVTDGARSRARAWAHDDLVTSPTARRTIGILAFAVATALGARAVVPLPGTPVPFTLQVIFILLAGAVLGPGLGAASQALYVAVGAFGAPVFAAGGGLAYLLGPTGGYLLAAPAAAFAVDAIAGPQRSAPRLALGILAGLAVVHLGGLAWLTVVTGDVGRAAQFGTLPFLVFDLVKVVLVFLIAYKVRERALELF